MVAHLVLGCGTVGNAVLGDIDGELRVLDTDENRVETLRSDGIDARTRSPTDREAVRDAGPADVVFVASDDPETNADAAALASEVHPGAVVVAYHGEDATRAQRERLARHADRTVDPGLAVVEGFGSVDITDADRGRRLREALRGVEGVLGVFAHDNPDPDAIASAMALVRIAHAFGVPAEVCYYGGISHQENRALVNRLEYDLRNLDEEEAPEYGGVALVDHSEPGVNDGLPADTAVDVIIDHHPSGRDPEATFVDVREGAGATSTMLTGYLRQFAIDPDPALATGLLYGIRVDTREFSRETTPADFDAAAFLLPHVDREAVEAIESPSVSGDTFDTIARAITNRQTERGALATCVGAITDRDTLSQAADRLLTMDGVNTTLVCGFSEGTIYVSARTRGTDVDLGSTLREAFGDIGSAGGHADMAGAQISLGLFAEIEEEAEGSLSTIIASVMRTRFFDALDRG